MRVSHIIPQSYVDGPGRRAVLFVQGCSLACSGCQNQHLWPAQGGVGAFSFDVALELYKSNSEAVTISGGEPFQQAEALARVVTHLRNFNPQIHVIVYTGYTYEELWDIIPGTILARVLDHIDIIVDGRFVRALDHDMMQYRGSANQRPINVQETLKSGHIVVEDWDTPELVFLPTGDVLMPVGMEGWGDSAQGHTRRCGQTS